MQWRTRSLIAAALGLTWSTPALACSFWSNSVFIPVPDRTTIGAGLLLLPGDYTLMVLSADANIKVGTKVALRPSVGMCRYEIAGVSETNIPFGVGVAFNVWNDAAGKMALNIQTGIEMNSYDGGSERNIPIGAALRIKSSDKLSWFAGGAIMMYNDSYDLPGGGDASESSSDPALFGGAMFAMGKSQLTAGLGLAMGDESDVYFNVGVSMPLGGASALKSFLKKK